MKHISYLFLGLLFTDFHLSFGQNYGPEKNLALEGVASQSSTYGDKTADRAIDGETNGATFVQSTAMTQKKRNSWWKVDLKRDDAKLRSVCVYKRAGRQAKLLNGSRLKVLDVNGKTLKKFRIKIKKTDDSKCFDVSSINTAKTIKIFRTGRSRKPLHIAEVEVYGQDPEDTQPPPNQSQFHITLKNMGQETAYSAAFEKAARKWESIVVGDLQDISKQSSSGFDWFGGEFDEAVNVNVDDLIIGYDIGSIDGLNGVLGYAGPYYVRSSKHPISGIMRFDEEDFAAMPASDVELVILHEMGHVLGIGTLWNYKCGVDCERTGVNDYTCPRAQEEYKSLGFSDKLQFQDQVCGHWAEKNFGSYRDELMTPYFDKRFYQPISRVTVGALEDLGYVVEIGAADPWLESTSRRMSQMHSRIEYEPPVLTFFLGDNEVLNTDIHILVE